MTALVWVGGDGDGLDPHDYDDHDRLECHVCHMRDEPVEDCDDCREASGLRWQQMMEPY